MQSKINSNKLKPPSTFVIIIDNDDADNYIAKRMIKKLLPEADIKTFTDAKKALDFIKTGSAKPNAPETLVFLDINMPDMTGWEFMKNFENLDEKTQQLFTIFMLTASEDNLDKERARADKKITGYLLKPLTEQALVLVIFNRKKKNADAKS